MYAAVSYRYKDIIQSLVSMGLQVIEVPSYKNNDDNYESSHADMQVLKIDDTVFLIRDNDILNERIAGECGHNIKYVGIIDRFVYPQCVKLNAVALNGMIIANQKYLDNVVKETYSDYKLIDVKQGYAKCSSAVVSNRAVITADESIIKACVENKIDHLRIRPGYIDLCERYGGFIGGSCFQIEDTMFFAGRIEDHPDYDRIKAFCLNYSVRIRSVTKSALTDIGGVVII